MHNTPLEIPFYIVFITAPNTKEANTLAKSLVQERLAACVNVIPIITSFYWWEDKLNEETECLLLCKTDYDTWPHLKAWVNEHHSYSVPEIIALPVAAGSEAYLNWLKESLKTNLL